MNDRRQGSVEPGSVEPLVLGETSGFVDAAVEVRPEDRPVRNPSVAAVTVDDHLVLAHEGAARPRVLDAVAAVVWQALDGAATVREIVEDARAALGDGSHAARLPGFVQSLADDAFISVDGRLTPGRPRRIDAPIDPEDCVGRRMGLGRAAVHQIDAGGRPLLRFGATDAEVAEAVARRVEARLVHRPDVSVTQVDPRDHEIVGPWPRTVVLRITRGRSRRVQQLFDTLSDVLYAGTDADEAVEAMVRTVRGLLDSAHVTERGSHEVWVNAPALVSELGVVLVHPAMHRYLTDDLRPVVFRSRWDFVPVGLMALTRDADGHRVHLPGLLDPDGESVSHPVRAVLAPSGDPVNEAEAAVVAAHVMLRWDSTHLAAAADLAATGPMRYLPVDSTVGDLADLIDGDAIG